MCLSIVSADGCEQSLPARAQPFLPQNRLCRLLSEGGERQKALIPLFVSTSPAAVVLELPLFKIADTPFAFLSRWPVAGALTGGLCTLNVKDHG